jgi:hypothetical protein
MLPGRRRSLKREGGVKEPRGKGKGSDGKSRKNIHLLLHPLHLLEVLAC